MTLEVPLSIFNDMIVAGIKMSPRIIAAIILFLVGWLLGRIIGNAVKRILKRLKIDKYFKISEEVELSSIFSVVISWIIYLLFIQTALSQEVLGIITLSIFFGKILEVVSRLLGGMVIIIVSYVLARYVQKQVVASKTMYSKIAGEIIFLFAMIIAISIALNFVNIDTKLIDNIILIIVGSVGLGVAIALGLGLKDTVAVVSKKYAKKL